MNSEKKRIFFFSQDLEKHFFSYETPKPLGSDSLLLEEIAVLVVFVVLLLVVEHPLDGVVPVGEESEEGVVELEGLPLERGGHGERVGEDSGEGGEVGHVGLDELAEAAHQLDLPVSANVQQQLHIIFEGVLALREVLLTQPALSPHRILLLARLAHVVHRLVVHLPRLRGLLLQLLKKSSIRRAQKSHFL